MADGPFANLSNDLPVMPPPPGVTSNFDNPDSLGPGIEIVSIVFNALALVFVFLRLYSKLRFTRMFGVDDWFCILAMVGAISHTVLVYISVPLGYGRHAWDIRASILASPGNVLTMGSVTVTYFLVTYFVKISCLCLFRRLFGVNSAFRRLVYWSIGVLSVAYAPFLGTAVAQLFLCRSYNALSVQFCQQSRMPTLANAVIVFVTDVYVLVLPISQVVRLRITRPRKIAIILVFATGGIACLVNAARIALLGRYLNDPDQSYYPGLTEVSIVEMNVGIIAACMPTLPALFKQSIIFKAKTYRSLYAQWRTSTFGHSSTAPRKSSSYDSSNGGSVDLEQAATQWGSGEKSMRHSRTWHGWISKKLGTRSSVRLSQVYAQRSAIYVQTTMRTEASSVDDERVTEVALPPVARPRCWEGSLGGSNTTVKVICEGGGMDDKEKDVRKVVEKESQY